MDVAGWLRRLGLEEYERKFREDRIGVDVLPSLTAEDLKDLGINLVGDRRRLLGASVAIVYRLRPDFPATSRLRDQGRSPCDLS